MWGQSMKNLLMIAYYYPPLAGVATIRPLQLSHYLREFGWDATILTVSEDPDYAHDYSAMSRIPSGQKIARAYKAPVFSRTRKLARKGLRKYPLLFSFVDEHFDWVPWAVRVGEKLLKNQRFDAIYATAPPYSSLRVARALKRRTGLPVVADLRDPFSANEFIAWPTPLHKIFYRAYETKLLNAMDRAVVVNEVLKRDIERNMGLAHLRPAVITNGYDPLDFDGFSPNPPKDKFVFGHVGSIHGAVTPSPFFASLSRALHRNPAMRNNVEIVFMGSMQEQLVAREARHFGLSSMVSLRGLRPHREAIELMHQCHVLLLLSGMSLPSVVPARLFEYGAARRPVLSFSKPGLLEDFIRKNEFGFSVDGSDPDAGADKVLDLFDEFKAGVSIRGPPRQKYEAFSRRNSARDLARILDSLTL